MAIARPSRPIGAPAPPGHPAGALGIIHPFPTVLVSLATVALASLAGGAAPTLAALGVGMLGFQSAIGATNDLADRARDRERGAAKPIPAGQIGVPGALAVAIGGALVGLVLAALVGPVVLVTGAVGLACGLAYDLWLRTRGLGTLAYAVALPTLLVHAWWGGAGTLPPGGGEVLLLAALMGPGLHLSNALVEPDLDTTLLARVGVRDGQRVAVAALGVVIGATHLLAWGVLAGAGLPMGPGTAMLVGGALAIVGVALSASRGRQRRALGWTCQAIATAALAVGLLGGLA